MIWAAWTGLAAGLLHVVSGPDHLAAVAPLSVRRHRAAWLTGCRWGIGHSAGVGLVALLLFALREVMPLPLLLISQWSERLVGVMLIGIGLWALRQGLKVQVHAHQHAHDGSLHEHVHFHSPDHRHAASASSATHGHGHAAFGIGTLHGLAGSSHFIGVLPTLALPDWPSAMGYLGGFGIGTVLAMTGFAGFLGWVARMFACGPVPAYRTLLYASGFVAMGVGGWWAWHGG